MRDDDKLGMSCKLMQIICVALHVRLVQRRFDLVEQAEGRRLQVLDREKQGDRSERLFSSGQLQHILQLLSRRLCNHTDTGVQNVLILHQLQRSLSASEQFPECLIEFPLDSGKLQPELLPHALVQIRDDLLQVGSGLYQVLMLCFQEIVALRQFPVFFNRVDVDVSEGFDLLPYVGQFFPDRGHGAEIVPAQLPAGYRRQLIFLPEIGDALLLVFLKPVQLVFQTEDLAVQKRIALAQLFPAVKERLLFFLNLFPAPVQAVQLLLQEILFLFSLRDLFSQGERLLPPALSVLFIFLKTKGDLLRFFPAAFQFLFQSRDILVCKLFLLGKGRRQVLP